jgi:hypothetical protein
MHPRSTITLTVLAAAGLARAQVADESFETSGPLFPNPAPWSQFSTNFGTPLCDGACFGPGEPTAARTGQWWAWFGGTDVAVEHGTLSQTVTIPAGTASLRFFLNADSDRADGQDVLRILLDTTVVFSIADLQLGPYTEAYVPFAIDISAFAGGTHVLTFDSLTNGGGFLTNFFIDDVTIITGPSQPCYPNCDDSTGSPLLTANDFQCFLNRFVALDPYANCDNSSSVPQLTANDFQCFVNRFAAGCS